MKSAKFVSLLFLVVIIAANLAACGGSAATEAPAAPADNAAPAATEAPAAAPAENTAAPVADVVQAFNFNNTGSVDICQLYLSTVDKSEWGPNQLPEGQKIAAGASFKLTNIPAGKYDVKWVGCDGTEGTVPGVDIKNQ